MMNVLKAQKACFFVMDAPAILHNNNKQQKTTTTTTSTTRDTKHEHRLH